MRSEAAKAAPASQDGDSRIDQLGSAIDPEKYKRNASGTSPRASIVEAADGKRRKTVLETLAILAERFLAFAAVELIPPLRKCVSRKRARPPRPSRPRKMLLMRNKSPRLAPLRVTVGEDSSSSTASATRCSWGKGTGHARSQHWKVIGCRKKAVSHSNRRGILSLVGG